MFLVLEIILGKALRNFGPAL